MKILGTADRGIQYIQEWNRWLNADLVDIDTLLSKNIAGQYDLILVWFIDKHHVDTYIPKLRRQAPDAKISILVDDDWKQTTHGEDIWEKELEGLKYVDVIFNCNYFTHKYLKERGYNSAYEVIMTPYTADILTSSYPIPKSFKERKKNSRGLAVFHSSGYNDPSNIIKTMRITGLKPTFIGNRWSTYQKMNELKNDEYFNWIDVPVEYLSFLNDGLIGLIDGYAGVGRFVQECASLRIPVVGTRTAFLQKEYAPPELCCDMGEIETLEEQITKLLTDESYYDKVGTIMHDKSLDFFNEEISKKRLKENLNKYLHVSLMDTNEL
jgi:hypothetical protein